MGYGYNPVCEEGLGKGRESECINGKEEGGEGINSSLKLLLEAIFKGDNNPDSGILNT